MKISAIQMATQKESDINLTMAQKLIEEAAAKGAQCAVLPENFINLGLTPEESFGIAEVFQAGPIQAQLARCAKKNHIWIIGGTLPLRTEDPNRVSASCLVYNSEGELVSRYDKIHLFDVEVGEGEIYQESAHVKPGEEIKVLSTPFGKIGLAVCYDMRFPELFRSLMLKGVDIIVLPSAFTIPTGKAHWEILLRARAIENLCYVVAPGQLGIRANGIGTYGHSMIIGPWGEIIASLECEQGVILAEIDLEKMYELRRQFPALTHYRSFVLESL